LEPDQLEPERLKRKVELKNGRSPPAAAAAQAENSRSNHFLQDKFCN